MKRQGADSVDSSLYQGIISNLPGIITIFENMIYFLSNLATSSSINEVFPADLMDEFEEEMSESPKSNGSISPRNSPRGFVHCINKCITQIISLENSMINILEDIMVFSETRWKLIPKTEKVGVDYFDSDSQSNENDVDIEIKKQREKYYKLLHEFEDCSNEIDSYEMGAKIHKFLHINKHLDIVNKFYKMVVSMKSINDNYIRNNSYELSKQKVTNLLEDGEKLERFCSRAVDKVDQYQKVIYQINTILELTD